MIKSQMKILFATDFSASAKTALANLEQFGFIYQPEIYMLHVITQSMKDWFSSGDYAKGAYQRLQTWQQKLQGVHRKDHIIVAKGNPSDEVILHANKLNVDLILLGGEKASPHKGFLTGSTAQKIVRHAKQSVLLSKSRTFEKILCAIDISEPASKALKQAIELARQHKVKLSILHVIPHPEFNPLGMTNEQVEKKELQFKQNYLKKINSFLQEFDFSNIIVNTIFPWGNPSRVILDLAEDFDYDLIVVGPTGHNKFKQALMGTTAEKVVAHAPCSLLVVR